jgi:hypothetical protein
MAERKIEAFTQVDADLRAALGHREVPVRD